MTKSRGDKHTGSAAQRTGPVDLRDEAVRETFESIVMAVILAFLFRTFVAEAFVIPTGSMAPTLEGNHKDVVCDECGKPYMASGSGENPDASGGPRKVKSTTCPICRHRQRINVAEDWNHATFSGDRILVSKFAYQMFEPERWDIIVFKYPKGAKTNYIKRLIGLPGETLRIQHGNIHVKRRDDDEFQLARRPDHKLKAMLQLVDDTKHISETLAKIQWPSRWQFQASSDETPVRRACGEDREPIALASDGEQWIRYRHLVPSAADWDLIDHGAIPSDLAERVGQLIDDFCGYNAYDDTASLRGTEFQRGRHWVPDLALECDVTLQSSDGELLLDLVKSGSHYRCRIDLATGVAALTIDAGEGKFEGDDTDATSRQARTKLRGGSRHTVRFTNVDDELRLWIDERRVEFDGPTTYVTSRYQPEWSEQDSGDAAPVGVGIRGGKARVERLRVLRDIYYIARARDYYMNDYQLSADSIEVVFTEPHSWGSSRIWESMASSDYVLGLDEFWPMGDNSPQSSDARYWGPLERRLLLGKALVIYWPHSWWRPIFWPNWKRMGFIR